MSLSISDANQKGGVTVPLFHCLFNGNTSVTHFMHDFDLEIYASLPNTYMVCVAKKEGVLKKVVAGFFMKTTYHHKDADFLEALEKVMMSDSGLSRLIGKNTSFFPSLVAVKGAEPLSEQEMLHFLVKKAMEQGVEGTA